VREGILQPLGRPEGAGEERGPHSMRYNALGLDPARSTSATIHGASHITGHRVVVVRKRRCRRRGRPRLKRGWLKPRQRTGDEIARRVGARSAAAGRRPRFVIPGGDQTVRIDRGSLLDEVGHAVILPGHLVPAHQLHANGPTDCLRQQRGIIRNRVRAVDAVAARSLLEDDVDALRPDSQDLRRRTAERPDRL